MKVSVYCTCGGSMVLEAPVAVIEEIVGVFREAHSGEGHKECDSKTAARARARAERRFVPRRFKEPPQ